MISSCASLSGDDHLSPGRSSVVDLSETYLATIGEHLAYLRRSQLSTIRAAGELLATTWREAGCLFVARTQHTLHGELLNRPSGPVAVAVLDDGGTRHDELVEHLPDVDAGDLVLIHANCGTTRKIVSIAETARRLGAATVALTQVSFERSDLVSSSHPSGRTLHEVLESQRAGVGSAPTVMQTAPTAEQAAISFKIQEPAPGEACINTSARCQHGESREERAAEIINLRPFRSVKELERVSGIGPGRLNDIKQEGLACVE
jgi:hypothetical protein